jgi:hypothetical protein
VDLFEKEALALKVRRLAEGFKKWFGELLKYDVEEELARLKASGFYYLLHIFHFCSLSTRDVESLVQIPSAGVQPTIGELGRGPDSVNPIHQGTELQHSDGRRQGDRIM